MEKADKVQMGYQLMDLVDVQNFIRNSHHSIFAYCNSSTNSCSNLVDVSFEVDEPFEVSESVDASGPFEVNVSSEIDDATMDYGFKHFATIDFLQVYNDFSKWVRHGFKLEVSYVVLTARIMTSNFRKLAIEDATNTRDHCAGNYVEIIIGGKN